MPLHEPLVGGAAGTVGSFGALALVLQVLITAAFYHAELDLSAASSTDSSSIYNFYVGVALMMFVGFGYLMTFLKAYGMGSVGLTMYITCIGVEYAIIAESYMSKGKLSIDFLTILNGNCAVAAVLISFGGLIGKISPVQITVLLVCELTCYCANKVYVLGQDGSEPRIADLGGSIFIHAFGAYFALCAGKMLGKPNDDHLNVNSYVSDVFAFIGTVFLWLFWPSFVAGGLPGGEEQTRALINTILALLASTVMTFAITPFLMHGKLDPVAMQNATLAGGVSIGATANLVGPFGAVVIGGCAGMLSTFGFCKKPFFSEVDTCGIHNLHGMPGVFGGLVSVAVPFLYTEGKAGLVNPTAQAMGLGVTLLIAGFTGSVTGCILKMLDTPKVAFTDEAFWECAEDIAK